MATLASLELYKIHVSSFVAVWKTSVAIMFYVKKHLAVTLSPTQQLYVETRWVLLSISLTNTYMYLHVYRNEYCAEKSVQKLFIKWVVHVEQEHVLI